MVNRVQTLRSSAPGVLPQAGTRQPGELWLNFADNALGFIDSSQTAQKLLGVRLFVATSNYAVGDFVVQGGNLYRAIAPSSAGTFVAANWSKVGTAQDLAAYLPLAGGTLTGALTLSADPSAATQAATKRYVDAGDAAGLAATALMLPLAGGTLTGALNGVTANFSGVAAAADPPAQDSSSKLVTTNWFNAHIPGAQQNRNRLINGNFMIDQWRGGATTTPTNAQYVCDRWRVQATQTGKFTTQQAMPTSGGVAAAGVLAITSASAYTPLATDAFNVSQFVEYGDIADLQWGSAQAQPVTLSFLAVASVAGTYSGTLRNNGSTRSYVFSFVLPANVWTPVMITIPGDTTGTWSVANTAYGLGLTFDLGSGANFRGPQGWSGSNLVGMTGAVSLVATNGATLRISNVQFELGAQATPFDWRSYGCELALCQRYYCAWGTAPAMTGWAGAAPQTFLLYQFLPVTMRAAPSLIGPSFINVTNLTSGAFAVTGPQSFSASGVSVAAGIAFMNCGVTALSAEF